MLLWVAARTTPSAGTVVRSRRLNEVRSTFGSSFCVWLLPALGADLGSAGGHSTLEMLTGVCACQ